MKFQIVKVLDNELEAHDFFEVNNFYKEYLNSIDYNLKFNFFYGDKASKLLAYAIYGITEKDGFQYAEFLANIKEVMDIA